jgi:hypothetical protein
MEPNKLGSKFWAAIYTKEKMTGISKYTLLKLELIRYSLSNHIHIHNKICPYQLLL